MRIMRYRGQKKPSGVTNFAVHEAWAGGGRIRIYWLAAVATLLISGAMYRGELVRLHPSGTVSALPSVQLSALPLEIGSWVAEDTALQEEVVRTAGVDDSLSRLYVNKSRHQWANIYAAFSMRPATMVGHRPEVCYVSAGWVLEGTEEGRFRSVSGRELPCRLHAFRKMRPHDERVVVLNYYVLNGDVVCAEETFSGVEWRGPNRSEGCVYYVAQIQISSALENSARAFAEQVTEAMLELLPDEEGVVKARRYSSLDGRGSVLEFGAASAER